MSGEGGSSSVELILRPPDAVRGITKLDKDLFSVNVSFPALEVEARDLGVITGRVRLEKYLIGHKLRPLKSVVDSENDSNKYILFNPDVVRTDNNLQDKIIALISDQLGEEKTSKLIWTFVEKRLTFENWDSKLLIKSVIPEEYDYSSYTQTGHIVHCNFPDHLLPYRHVIAEILLEKINYCRTVVQKSDIITNVFRNLNLELLAGEPDYVTEVKEEGLRFKLDFSKVYWNSRLSGEHSRVIKKFDKNSLVYDACAGIGPFVLPATVKRRPRRVVANDLNPDSAKWLIVNIDLNKIGKSDVEVHNKDAREFITKNVVDDFMKEIKKDGEAPSGVHIIMNLPAFAINFLPHFKGLLHSRLDDVPKEKRCPWTIYCYLFVKSSVDVPDAWYEEEARRICDEKLGWTTTLITNLHNVRTVSSRKEMFCAEISLTYDYLASETNGDDSEEEPEFKKPKL